MQTQTKPIHPLMWIAGIALIVFCGAGIAAFMGWIPGTAGGPAEPALATKLDPPRAAARARAPAPVPVAAVCLQCGIVQSVVEVEDKGKGTGLGVAGGAVVGGVLGSQVGHGDGRKLATVVGAVGGAVLGNDIERRARSVKRYEVTVRMESGAVRVITEDLQPAWRAGDKVRIVDGALQAGA
ncbi:MAG: glycine zipper 2TM domain-containing protein [Burkholderiales bacterium]